MIASFLWRPAAFFSVFLLALCAVQAEEKLPPPPAHYFNDTVGLVSPTVAAQLDRELARFDQQTSTQIVVLITPRFSPKTSLEEEAQQLYTAWHLGTKKESNGALLLVFPKEHQIRIQTGYGLEGALPDALCKRIIDEVMTPAFQHGHYDQGMIAGVTAMMKATAGEYHVSKTLQKKPPLTWKHFLFSPLGLFLLMIFGSALLNRTNRYRSPGNSGWFIGGFGSGMERGAGSDSDFGDFSGGGGDSGGGGASGGW